MIWDKIKKTQSTKSSWVVNMLTTLELKKTKENTPKLASVWVTYEFQFKGFLS